jgi:hypothetical protein
MGLKGSGSTSKLKWHRSLVASSSTTETEVYLDDILVYGDTPQEYLEPQLLEETIKEYGVLLSPKSAFQSS